MSPRHPAARQQPRGEAKRKHADAPPGPGLGCEIPDFLVYSIFGSLRAPQRGPGMTTQTKPPSRSPRSGCPRGPRGASSGAGGAGCGLRDPAAPRPRDTKPEPLARSPPAGPYLTATLTQQSPWPAMAGVGAGIGDPGPGGPGPQAAGGGRRGAAAGTAGDPRAHLPPARTAHLAATSAHRRADKGGGGRPGPGPAPRRGPAPPPAPPSAPPANRRPGPAAGGGAGAFKTTSWRAAEPCAG